MQAIGFGSANRIGGQSFDAVAQGLRGMTDAEDLQITSRRRLSTRLSAHYASPTSITKPLLDRLDACRAKLQGISLASLQGWDRKAK